MTEQMDRNPEIQQYLSEARAHVQRNLIPAVKGRECVDGRYDQHGVASGMIARPGGDFGYVMALLAVNKAKNFGLSPEQVFDKVYDAITRDGDKFYEHTDHHATNPNTVDKPLTGCGHIAKSASLELQDSYGVFGVDVRRALEYSREKTKHEAVEEIDLPGEHEEKGVLIMRGMDYTLEHNDPDNNSMYFVYDQDRDDEFMKKLVQDLAIDGLTYDDFKAASDKQLNATVGKLAEGKPLFEVHVKDGNPDVQFVKIV